MAFNPKIERLELVVENTDTLPNGMNGLPAQPQLKLRLGGGEKSSPMDITVLEVALGKTVCRLASTMLSKVLAVGIVIIEATEGSDV